MLLNDNDNKALVTLLEKSEFPCAVEFVEKTVKKIMEEDDLPLRKVLLVLLKSEKEMGQNVLLKALKKSGILDKLNDPSTK